MGVDDALSRWFMELVVHRNYLASLIDYQRYGFIDRQSAVDLHDEGDCLLTRKSKTEYWKNELVKTKATGNSQEIMHVTRILSKYIRGVYQ